MACDMLDIKDHSLLSSADHAQGLSSLPLCEQVRLMLSEYFDNLEGESVADLYNMVMSEVERPLLQVTLERCNYNQSRAATMLGISRGTLRKKISHYKLE
jgi:Fis family transcriptional regulator, factor for inversion stimulation protein